MKSSFGKFVVLILTFVAAFALVLGIKTCQQGGSPLDFLDVFHKKQNGNFRPESYTLPEKAPLELSDVELLTRINAEYADLTKAVLPSVVSIDTTGVKVGLENIWGRTFSRLSPTQGQGSGVIVTKEGHIITNLHVIAGQQMIRVRLHDGRTFPARFIGDDPLLDIAVLKIDDRDSFQPLKFGDSSQAEVGQLVFAVGSPFGLGETVTQGIISAKERSISDTQRDLFQTDAAINPGNSGGPLVNLRGEIIGINVSIYSQDKENPGFQGVGFSIPSNDVKDTLTQILERGRPVRGYLGVTPRDTDSYVRANLDYHGPDATVVLTVDPGSPAEKAGLLPKDIIQSYDGKVVMSRDSLIRSIQGTPIGTSVSIGIWRNGQSKVLQATIAESKTDEGTQLSAPNLGKTRDPDQVLRAIGLLVRDTTPQERMRGIRGVIVVATTPNAFADGKVLVGDIVLGVNSTRIVSARDFYIALATSAAVQDTTLLVYRGPGRALERVMLPALPREK